MKHKRIVVALTCSIFAIVCLLSVFKLFSVSDIKVNYSVYNENVEEVESMLEKYSGKLIFFVNTSEIESEITQNRYLKVVSVKKQYPCSIIVDLVERGERYALKASDGWYFLDEEFFAVRSAQTADSINGEKLTAITFYDVNGAETLQSCSLKRTFEFPYGADSSMREMLSSLGDVGENVLEIRFISTPEQGNYRVDLYMAEGVIVEIQKAGEDSLEKLKVGISAYSELSVEKRMRGKIVVNKTVDGVIKAEHES